MDQSQEGAAHTSELIERPRPKARWPWVLGFFAVALLSGVGIYLGWQLIFAQKADLEATQARMADAQEQVSRVQADKAALEKRIAALESEKAALEAAKNDLSKDVAAKDEELQKLKGTFDQLQDKMQAEITKGEIRLSQEVGKLRVDLVDKVLFKSGEAEITPHGEEVLARVGAILAGVADKQIQVSGHTDDEPISKTLVDKFPTNWELSAARALNVVRFLEEKANVPGKRLVASANGPYQPIATNGTPVGRARNRRIEILLTPVLPVGKVDAAKVPPARPTPAPTPAPKPAEPATKTQAKNPKAK